MQINNNYYNTNGYQSTNVRKQNTANRNNPLNENKHYFGNISLGWSDGAVSAYGTPEGNSFSVYKAENYSVEEPWMYVKGMDTDGNYYEQKVNVKEVNPRNASFTEIQALNSYLELQGKLKTQSLSFFPRENNDDLVKRDYMSLLEDWRDMQKSVGNWAGYKKFSDVCNAFASFCK